MIRHWLLQLWLLCWLVVVWVLLWGNISVANIVSGFALAIIITLLFPLPVAPVEGLLRPLSLLRTVVWIGWWLVQSSAHVLWLTVKPGPPPPSAVLRAQLGLKSDLVFALAVHALNLTPGTVVVDIVKAEKVIYVHVLDVSSPDAVDRFHRQIAHLERLLTASFERDEDWRPARRRIRAEEQT